ncbi:MAG: hypothetical protein R3E42_15540 [Burkholderiaceae bacterium]
MSGFHDSRACRFERRAGRRAMAVRALLGAGVPESAMELKKLKRPQAQAVPPEARRVEVRDRR